MSRTVVLLILLMFIYAIASASSLPEAGRAACIGQDCTKCHSLSSEKATELLRPLDVTVHSIKLAPIQGMFEVLVKRADQQGIIYVDYAKKHIMQGVVVKVATMEAISAHVIEPPQLQKKTVFDHKQIPIQHSIVMGNPNAIKKLFVFTDPDCPYCRNLHGELVKLEKLAPDLAIHIMLYPLPMHPQAYDKARLLVSTKDKDQLNKAFDGKEIPKPSGDEGKAAIDAIIKFAQSHDIKGTPTMVMPNGELLVGVRDAESLKKLIAAQ
ncbi:MAG: DsbC family protein [Verrucomicrobia bacterium]|nr:DsbC family protein [Deltaproteobacteria bacterium]